MGTNAMFKPKRFCTYFMFTLGSKIKALDRPWIYVAPKNWHTKLMVVIYITFFYTIQHYLFPNKIFEKLCFSEYQNFTQKQVVLRMVENSSLPILGGKKIPEYKSTKRTIFFFRGNEWLPDCPIKLFTIYSESSHGKNSIVKVNSKSCLI